MRREIQRRAAVIRETNTASYSGEGIRAWKWFRWEKPEC